tara:strand:- start:2298 stop:2858 length:561 start_codon:yes stop_codon:yes gene_type:complete
MNPTLNKKDFDDLSTNLRDLAYSYIEKYSPSKQQLKVYLMKKYLTKFRSEKTKKEVSSLIDIILENLEKNKFLNDEIYSDSKARNLMKRGYSLMKINHTLKTKGLEDSVIKKSLQKIKENKIEPDFVSAIKLCKRRKIGAARPSPNRELFYKKDMGVLARAGFSYELSKRILEIEKTEFEKLLKII